MFTFMGNFLWHWYYTFFLRKTVAWRSFYRATAFVFKCVNGLGYESLVNEINLSQGQMFMVIRLFAHSCDSYYWNSQEFLYLWRTILPERSATKYSWYHFVLLHPYYSITIPTCMYNACVAMCVNRQLVQYNLLIRRYVGTSVMLTLSGVRS